MARRHLREHGADGLSLRAVARDLGMVSSSMYRYFSSRDDLLTALIIEAYDAVGAAAEKAATNRRGDLVGRWLRVARAVRAWALANPHDYALIYGSPVPGYRAPQTTISPALRVSLAALNLLGDAVAEGEPAPVRTRPVPRRVHADLERLRTVTEVEIPDELLARMLLLWTALFGSISFELFGHFHNVIDDHDAFFDTQMTRAASLLFAE